jgi:hypothetical protein
VTKGWTLVVAGSYREFEQWCQDQRVSLRQLHEARVAYAASPELVSQLPLVRVVYTGTWHQRDLALLEAVEQVERSVSVVRG